MTGTAAHEGLTRVDQSNGPDRPKGFWWWLRAAEVRLRFVLITGLALLVATQWGRLQTWSQYLVHAWSGHSAEAAVSGDTEFFCPMDPGVISDWPAICPICNMDLVPRKKSEAQLLPEGVVARMQLTPYRIQLAGIRTSAVVPMPLEHQIEVFGVLAGTEFRLLSFDAPVSREDLGLLEHAVDAVVTPLDESGKSTSASVELVRPWESSSSTEVPRVRITLSDPDNALAEGTRVRAIVRVPVATGIPEVQDDTATAANGMVLAIPESAVVDHGYQQLVFVETMDGMFDAVVVELGRRCGDYYPVLSGLDSGERVVVNGAFLIDAETRLNPSLSVQYFGANQASASGRMPQLRVAGVPTELSPEDLQLAERQSICPVTMKPLDSMGGPVLVMVEGRKVFICCRGCENALTSDPAKYLERLPSDD